MHGESKVASINTLILIASCSKESCILFPAHIAKTLDNDVNQCLDKDS